jgi:hypothetical protein
LQDENTHCARDLHSRLALQRHIISIILSLVRRHMIFIIFGLIEHHVIFLIIDLIMSFSVVSAKHAATLGSPLF